MSAPRKPDLTAAEAERLRLLNEAEECVRKATEIAEAMKAANEAAHALAKHGLILTVQGSMNVGASTEPATEPGTVFDSASTLGALTTPAKRGSRWNPDSPTARSKTESEVIIRELGRPVPLSELSEKLADRGIKLGGQNPRWALSANLGRHPPLISTPRGWWLRDVPLPPVKEVDLLANIKTNGEARADH